MPAYFLTIWFLFLFYQLLSYTSDSSNVSSPVSQGPGSPQSPTSPTGNQQSPNSTQGLNDTKESESTPSGGLPGYTKQYDYVEEEKEKSKRHKLIGAFSYEDKKKSKDKDKKKKEDGKKALAQSKESSVDENEPPVSPVKKTTGLAWTYAPGEAQKLAQSAAEKRKNFLEKNDSFNKSVEAGLKTGSLDGGDLASKSVPGRGVDALKAGKGSSEASKTPVSDASKQPKLNEGLKTPGVESLKASTVTEPGLRTPGLDYVESAARKEKLKNGKRT